MLTKVYLQKSVSIQPRRSPPEFVTGATHFKTTRTGFFLHSPGAPAPPRCVSYGTIRSSLCEQENHTSSFSATSGVLETFCKKFIFWNEFCASSQKEVAQIKEQQIPDVVQTLDDDDVEVFFFLSTSDPSEFGS